MIAPEVKQQIALAVNALHMGDGERARRLLAVVLRDDPGCVRAWRWAAKAARTPEERVYCLRRVLKLEPDDDAVRRYLMQLLPPSDSTKPQASGVPVLDSAPARLRPHEMVLAPVFFLLHMPPQVLLGILAALSLLLGFGYYRGNTDFFGLVNPDFESFLISGEYEEIEMAYGRWSIVYEARAASTFTGVVRHASTIRDRRFPMLTHDVLVTSGDFADTKLVRTSVINHYFTWRSMTAERPVGAINLLHAVPADEAIHRQLLALRVGDGVSVSGREILNINAYDTEGQLLGTWQDKGCNTLLVTAVELSR